MSEYPEVYLGHHDLRPDQFPNPALSSTCHTSPSPNLSDSRACSVPTLPGKRKYPRRPLLSPASMTLLPPHPPVPFSPFEPVLRTEVSGRKGSSAPPESGKSD